MAQHAWTTTPELSANSWKSSLTCTRFLIKACSVLLALFLLIGGLSGPGQAKIAHAATAKLTDTDDVGLSPTFVQHHPKVYLVFWGPKWSQDTGTISVIENTFSVLAGSSYNNILTQYTDSPISATDLSTPNPADLANGNFVHNDVELMTGPEAPYGRIIDTSSPPGGIDIGLETPFGVLWGAQIRNEADKEIAANGWAVNQDSQVIVFPQQGTTYNSLSLPQNWCGMHVFNSTAPAHYAYTVVQYGDQTRACGGASATNIAYTAVHEYAEAATDPVISGTFPAVFPIAGNGWNLHNGSSTPQEVADLCENMGGFWYAPSFGGGPYWLPYLWDNASGSCQQASGGTRGASQAVSQPDGTVDTFFKGTDGALYHADFVRGSGWTTAAPMSGTAPLGSEPSAVTSSAGIVDVFWKGSDAKLWHVFYLPGSGWTSTAQSLGDGPLGGAPKAVAQPNGSIHVFWRGTDNNIWQAWFDPGAGWQGPQRITSTGNVTSDPSPVASRTGTWDVFWKGSDANLWHVFWNPGGPWNTQDLGAGPLGGTPQAIGQQDGQIEVFWRGTNNYIWQDFYFPGAGWLGRTSISSTGNVVGDPAPVNSSFDTWDVFWKGSNGDLWHVFWNATGTAWTTQNLGDGTLGGEPFATGQYDGTIDVFWKGTGNPAHLWHAWFNAGSPWAGPQDLGGQVA